MTKRPIEAVKITTLNISKHTKVFARTTQSPVPLSISPDYLESGLLYIHLKSSQSCQLTFLRPLSKIPCILWPRPVIYPREITCKQLYGNETV